ncbi:Alcohol dehydrogenase zinc-binding domain protein [Candidatus Protofrankia datiscae]|uniref:Alcohol dehydrogenase zinc-binding domain protein n=1 Tax=Candidatus Protofrankia datiscae TaxID=2716812 RepID=F8B0J9_9ACTN|nr:zinc-binding dehydrogenase [Candidatus Protofrankia datiscae]AEH09754.1 Alcohol dehydrogenase zinc-binding domain protein [Candidatus Protofrankia datiscae]
MSRALELYRSLPRYLTTRTVSGRLPSLAGAAATTTAPLRLRDRPTPSRPGPDWVTIRPRLSGICGSDLATVTGRSSFYFASLVSMPFVPGHEIVADTQTDVTLSNGTELSAGSRVVVDPVLGCAARGLPACTGCAGGHTSRCDRVTSGHVSPGLQTGFCADTGGGWSGALVAHRSQLYPVPADLPDERAVLVEPLACAVHTALRAAPADGDRVLVIGAGAVGLFTLLALRAYTRAGTVTVVAKHRRQVELARLFGADEVLPPASAVGGVRRGTRALRLDPEVGPPYLLGGVDVAIDCAGSASSLSTALRTTRAGGRVVLSGVPTGSVDLTPLWFRELELVGAYASSAGTAAHPAVRLDAHSDDRPDNQVNGHAGGRPRERSDFDRALELAASAPLDGILSATYPLDRWRDALDHALSAGRLGAVKVAFDLMTP